MKRISVEEDPVSGIIEAAKYLAAEHHKTDRHAFVSKRMFRKVKDILTKRGKHIPRVNKNG